VAPTRILDPIDDRRAPVHFGDLVLADEAQRAELGGVGGLGEGEVVPGGHGASVGVGDANVEAHLGPRQERSRDGDGRFQLIAPGSFSRPEADPVVAVPEAAEHVGRVVGPVAGGLVVVLVDEDLDAVAPAPGGIAHADEQVEMMLVPQRLERHGNRIFVAEGRAGGGRPVDVPVVCPSLVLIAVPLLPAPSLLPVVVDLDRGLDDGQALDQHG
jgi:hypothetical protein